MTIKQSSSISVRSVVGSASSTPSFPNGIAVPETFRSSSPLANQGRSLFPTPPEPFTSEFGNNIKDDSRIPNGIPGPGIETTFVLPSNPFGNLPSGPTSRSIDIGSGVELKIIGNVNIGHANITDSLEVEGTIDCPNLEGDGSNLSGLSPSTNRSKVIAFQYILGDPPLIA